MPTSPEVFLISSILRNGDVAGAVTSGLKAEMFHGYPDEWAWIETYFGKYRKTPSRAAFIRMFPEFRIRNVDDTEHFTEEVRKSHARFMLTNALRDVTDLIAKGDIDHAVTTMQSSVLLVASSMGNLTDTDIFTDYDAVLEEVKRRKARFDEFGMAGFPTGFDTLDERTGGVQPGQFWVWGARLGEGKTWSLMKCATACVLSGYTIQFDALEMSRPEVSMRIHNMMSSRVGETIFRSLDLAQGRDFDIRAYRKFLKALRSDIKGKMHVASGRGIGSTEIAAQVERNRPDILFLDYIGLAKTKGDGGWQDVGALAKDLKNIASEYQIGVVAAAQLNRENGLSKSVPGAEALALSDAIGQDADALVNQKKRSEHVTEYLLAKYRHGPSGYRWFSHMDMDKGIFDEVSYNKAQDLIDRDKDEAAKAEENAR